MQSLVTFFKQIRTKAFQRILYSRLKKVEAFKKNPHKTQQQVLAYLLKQGARTQFGHDHHLDQIHDYDTFHKQVPVYDYPTFRPYVDNMLKGHKSITWPGRVHWFAMSSGTTGGRSKFLPITREGLQKCHYQAGGDVFAMYYHLNPKARVASGKNLVLGGSHQVNKLNAFSRYGDLSAVLLQNLPFWARFNRAPSLSTALMEDWEAKIDQIARETRVQNITSLLGVPTWTLVLIEKLFELTGKDNLADIWPNLELYIHGGVSFDPYRQLFRQIIRKSDMHYLETYNASEGFFGLQDQWESSDLLLLLDYGIFFEFIDQEKSDNRPEPLWNVKPDKNYALVISTNSGLWRYKIGDTVRFTSTNPYRFRLTGRTQHFINAFGEEVIVENAEKAVAKACEETGAIVNDYTTGPVYFEQGKQGTHEWLIEFEQPPQDLHHFRDILDQHLQAENSDYAAKRFKNMALAPPIVRKFERGTFYQFMKAKNKLGGQHKVPRLANNRNFIEQLLQFTSSLESTSN